MVVDEQQRLTEQLNQKIVKVQDLSAGFSQAQEELSLANARLQEEEQKVFRLEAELREQASRHHQDQEAMTAKLTSEDAQNRHLRQKLSALSRQLDELGETNKTLRRAEEELQEMRDKISRGECGNSSLMSELEELQKRVLEMEGKDEELIRMEDQCRDLNKKLEKETKQSRCLKAEVDQLNHRITDLEKLEDAFSKSKQECISLKSNLEKERTVSKVLSSELEALKVRVKELEATEGKVVKTEQTLKEDLTKLKTLTVMLVDERKAMADKLKQMENKVQNSTGKLQAEQNKVTSVTEKLIEESKKFLKFKSETEVQLEGLTLEREELQSTLRSSEEERDELNEKLKKMRADRLEEMANRDREEDNRVQKLTTEIERLRGRLEQLQVVEGDLMRSEDEYDLLEKKFRHEQDRANTLSKLVDEMKAQVPRSKAVERGEAKSLEAQLRIRCKVEEAKTRELRVEVLALKEKIHELMNKEDQLSQLQVDFSVLQQRFLEEEEKKRRLSVDVENLARELEASKRYSRALRPGVNGRRMVDIPVTSTAVQTESNGSAEDETAAGFIWKSVQEENHLMNNLRQHGLKRPTVLNRYPPASADHGLKCSTPWMGKKEAVTPTQTRGSSSMSPNLGRPLHIRVTPDHGTSTATLEITSPRSEDFFSTTTIIPTLGLQQPRITIVPKPSTVCTVSGDPDRAKSPVMVTSISRTKSPEKPNSIAGVLQSPVSIITVSTTPVAEVCASSDPHESTTRRTLIKMTSEKPPERKFNSNIVTTEDNKIHIHLGSQFQRSSEGSSSPLLTLRPTGSTCDCQETGTVLRSPRQNKMTSSITINPVTSAASRPTQPLLSSDMQSAPSAASRIPVQLNGKTVVGVSAVTRLESRAEGQAMKIELRKSAVCSSASAAGGKS